MYISQCVYLHTIIIIVAKLENILDRRNTGVVHGNGLKTLSFFTGAMGLDIGLEEAGFNTLLACEIDQSSRQTIVANKPEIGLIKDIRNYSVQQILDYAGLTHASEVDVMAGGPPCQAFSTAGNRKGLSDERGNVFLKYIECIEQIKPKYIILENVRGLMSSAYEIEIQEVDRHILTPETASLKGSTLYYITRRLERAGYNISFNLYNSANYGSPQQRERVIITGVQSKRKLNYLKPTNSNNVELGLKPWKTLRDAIQDLKDIKHEYIEFPEKRLKYYRLLTSGQNWRNLTVELQKEALGNSYYLGGGKTGFYRRLDWEKPSNTLLTHPAMPATDLGHPEEDRPLSVQEYKRIQEFPDSWEIKGSILNKYKQIGNAVPVSVGRAIGDLIMRHSQNQQEEEIPGFSYSRYKNTSDKDFLLDFENKARTILRQISLTF
jgi:DNA (cytosine-5)-methyltransferase 1